GRIVLIEHLRDVPNFLAFTVGFFHFFPRQHWRDRGEKAGFELEEEEKITPFVSAFVLVKR
ncbi:MAG: methyltransferase, partial [Verrucomicrobiota bacterium]